MGENNMNTPVGHVGIVRVLVDVNHRERERKWNKEMDKFWILVSDGIPRRPS
jgi:hypothetical protein